MKQLLKATIMFISSLALFTAVVYAWFTNSNYSNIQPMNVQTIERNLDMDIEFGINGGGYSSFDNPADINAYLSAMKPGDLINIRVVILNSNSLASPDLDLNIMLFNIRASETSAPYDLTNYFYLENGTINLTWYQNINEYYASNPYSIQSILISQINETQIEYIGVSLQSYRLSNIFNHYMVGEDLIIENNIDVLETTIASQELIIVEFSLGLDAFTPDDEIGIQDGELLIDGLYTFFEE